jgi:hypothetical protein
VLVADPQAPAAVVDDVDRGDGAVIPEAVPARVHVDHRSSRREYHRPKQPRTKKRT